MSVNREHIGAFGQKHFREQRDARVIVKVDLELSLSRMEKFGI
jgi:hypothetical protein